MKELILCACCFSKLFSMACKELLESLVFMRILLCSSIKLCCYIVAMQCRPFPWVLRMHSARFTSQIDHILPRTSLVPRLYPQTNCNVAIGLSTRIKPGNEATWDENTLTLHVRQLIIILLSFYTAHTGILSHPRPSVLNGATDTC